MFSAELPPHRARSPRSRETIEDVYRAIPLSTSGSNERWDVAVEVLLDIRELVAECAWRLSDIQGELAASEH